MTWCFILNELCSTVAFKGQPCKTESWIAYHHLIHSRSFPLTYVQPNCQIMTEQPYFPCFRTFSHWFFKFFIFQCCCLRFFISYLVFINGSSPSQCSRNNLPVFFRSAGLSLIFIRSEVNVLIWSKCSDLVFADGNLLLAFFCVPILFILKTLVEKWRSTVLSTVPYSIVILFLTLFLASRQSSMSQSSMS